MKRYYIALLVLVAVVTAVVVLNQGLPTEPPHSENISFRDGANTFSNRRIADWYGGYASWEVYNLGVAKIATTDSDWYVALPYVGWTYGGTHDVEAGTISLAATY